MKIRDYIKEYTSKNVIYFKDVLEELREFFAEAVKLNKSGTSEEFGDFFLFLQAWLCCRFGINGEIWKIAQKSAEKFANRRKVWREIYSFVGLEISDSGYVGNYMKIEKLVSHLQNFNISQEKAEAAYEIVVRKYI